MRPLFIEVDPEFIEFALEVDRIPKEDLVEILSPDGADETPDEGMRQRNVWHGFELVDLENSEIYLPPIKQEQWIVVAAEVSRSPLVDDGLIEHPAQRRAVDMTDLDTKADDPTAELVHHHHDPMSFQQNRFASKQVDAPEAVFHVPNEG